MNRQVLLLGGLLGLAMVGSYWTWTHPEDTSAEETVVLLDGKAEGLASVKYESEKLTVELSPREDARGRFVWVKTLEKKKKKKPLDPVTPDTPPGETPEPAPPEVEEFEEVIKEFASGKAGLDLVDSLAPFKATRELGDIGPDKLETFGLKEPEATLTITRTGKEPKVYKVGGEAYGSRDRYILDVATGKVYLIGKDTLTPLKSASSRLPERELLGVAKDQIVKVKATGAAGALELEHKNRQDAKAAQWVRPGEAQEAEAAANWLDKALGLKGTAYVQADEVPTGLEERLRLEVTDAEGKVVTLVISEGTDPKGAKAWYAKSENTRELMKLSTGQARDLADDLGAVLPGAPEPATPPGAPPAEAPKP